jgi:hypothetical protein
MPKITNRVLTSPKQGLDETKQKNARDNIGAQSARPFSEGSPANKDHVVIIGKSGELADSKYVITPDTSYVGDGALTLRAGTVEATFTANQAADTVFDMRWESSEFEIPGPAENSENP